MIEYKTWPPPEDWTSVTIAWDWLMEHHSRDPNVIYNWVVRSPGGRFHLSGYNAGAGFDYRFEDSKDATWFRMNLPQ